VRAFVRPHDIQVEARVDDASPTPDGPSVARIERLSRVGWMVKAELRLPDGQPLSVELTKDRIAELGLSEGDRVLVNLRDAKIFVQDYAI
jgi:sulfate transport system ATP-binding protein